MRSRLLPAFFGLTALLAATSPAGAETRVSVDGANVHVSDIDPGAPAELAGIELGRTPPPGASRVITRADIRQKLREAGADPTRVTVPSSVRIESPAERWSAAEVAVRADAIVRSSLPPGVSLVRLGASQGVLVPPGTDVAAVRPSIPHGVGRHDVTVVAELRRNNQIVARAQLLLTVEVGEDAFAPIVRKGDRMTVVVDQGNARIGASAMAMADANQGDSIWFKVTSTGKVLKARVATRDLGVVVDL